MAALPATWWQGAVDQPGPGLESPFGTVHLSLDQFDHVDARIREAAHHLAGFAQWLGDQLGGSAKATCGELTGWFSTVAATPPGQTLGGVIETLNAANAAVMPKLQALADWVSATADALQGRFASDIHAASQATHSVLASGAFSLGGEAEVWPAIHADLAVRVHRALSAEESAQSARNADLLHEVAFALGQDLELLPRVPLDVRNTLTTAALHAEDPAVPIGPLASFLGVDAASASATAAGIARAYALGQDLRQWREALFDLTELGRYDGLADLYEATMSAAPAVLADGSTSSALRDAAVGYVTGLLGTGVEHLAADRRRALLDGPFAHVGAVELALQAVADGLPPPFDVTGVAPATRLQRTAEPEGPVGETEAVDRLLAVERQCSELAARARSLAHSADLQVLEKPAAAYIQALASELRDLKALGDEDRALPVAPAAAWAIEAAADGRPLPFDLTGVDQDRLQAAVKAYAMGRDLLAPANVALRAALPELQHRIMVSVDSRHAAAMAALGGPQNLVENRQGQLIFAFRDQGEADQVARKLSGDRRPLRLERALAGPAEDFILRGDAVTCVGPDRHRPSDASPQLGRLVGWRDRRAVVAPLPATPQPDGTMLFTPDGPGVYRYRHFGRNRTAEGYF